MERADAERVFALVAEIGGDIRGRIVSERWWIWTTFVLAATCVGLFNQAVGLPLFFNAPILGLLAAIAFSMMAMVTHRYFLVQAVIFMAIMVAMSLFPHVQFLLYGGGWCVVLVMLGIFFRLSIAPHPARPL